ncbi:prolyl aminopeptidase [Roseomonas sp. E05]|uniref:prolyl aminopeptidase n=1 Tax=Roseomonas sp. E05 TaxID=3046310 RepID=UPI0024BA2318|nr:prolyl aminopeptidase [Roseomonas sp. E05]MDJ0389428.1 prolyl aminopeptidase [Roseomonas sp. E05]
MPQIPTLDSPLPDPVAAGHLDVGQGHRLAWWEYGRADAPPVVFLHGGPGAGSNPSVLRSLDLSQWRVLRFDQRGCGDSTPHASTEANTTAHLVADLERLRAHFGVPAWAVMGHSWGSCLGLAYAQAHPERVTALRLSGIFTARKQEVAWWFHGVRSLFPDHWAEFAAHVPEAERGDLLAAYHRRLMNPDPAVHIPAGIALRGFSARTQTFRPDPAHIANLTEPAKALAVSRLFTDYCMHGAWLEEGQLLREVGRIRHIPAAIVQARYDVVTPAVTAFELHQAWPEADFTIVNDGNHTTGEPEVHAALYTAAARLRERIG